MTILQWDDSRHRLGIKVMDETHQAFARLVNKLAETDDSAAFARLFDMLAAHTRFHFEQEERLMQESGFPAIGEHRDEHARILGQIDQLAMRIVRGRSVMARAFVNELPTWFELHAATMDSALAAHLIKRRV